MQHAARGILQFRLYAERSSKRPAYCCYAETETLNCGLYGAARPLGRGDLTQIQIGARRLILVKLGLGRKMKHIQAISKYSFVLYF